MERLEPEDLQAGDILIFENNDFSAVDLLTNLMRDYNEKEYDDKMHTAFYLLLYLIPWFDPGDEGENYKNIYHTAIWANIDLNRGKGEPEFENRIVQIGRGGIVSDILPRTLGESTVKNVYVYRKTARPAGFEEKVNEATRAFYNDEKTPYSFETAWLLAVICSLRYSDGTLHKMLEDRLGKTGTDLMVMLIRSLINHYNDKHQKKMVACSTLVAMIYKNAGFPVHIDALKRDQEIHLPSELSFKADHLQAFDLPSNPQIPRIGVVETVVTPRQLAESPDVKLVGYFPHHTRIEG
ncbi:hypothetical protein [Roseivirga sp.]|uniref:hypothetical protein n=1 Tax=Roseivirga sp. TaxID=1964215 RepID=UPI003B527105